MRKDFQLKNIARTITVVAGLSLGLAACSNGSETTVTQSGDSDQVQDFAEAQKQIFADTRGVCNDSTNGMFAKNVNYASSDGYDYYECVSGVWEKRDSMGPEESCTAAKDGAETQVWIGNPKYGYGVDFICDNEKWRKKTINDYCMTDTTKVGDLCTISSDRGFFYMGAPFTSTYEYLGNGEWKNLKEEDETNADE